MANRYIVMGQLYITDVTAGVSVTGRVVADTAFTCTGAGTFTVDMANGTTGSISGTNVQGSPVALSAGANTITTTGAVADGQIDITIGTAANTNSVNTYSAASGGACGASIPTSADNLYGDANSFTAASQVLTVNATLSMLDLDFTGSLYTPTLALGVNNLFINGDATFIAAMVQTGTGIYFDGSSATCKLTTNGLTLVRVSTRSLFTGTLTLQDNLTTSDANGIYHQRGTLDTNNKTVVCAGIFRTDGAGVKVLTLGSSSITCGRWDEISTGGSLTFSANTATINCSGNVAGGGLDYNGASMNCTATAPTVSGANTWANLTYASGSTVTETGCQTIAAGGTYTATGAKIIMSYAAAATIYDVSAAATVNPPDSITITDANADALAFKGQGSDVYPLVLLTGAGAYTVTFTGGDTITWLSVDNHTAGKILVADSATATVTHSRSYDNTNTISLGVTGVGGGWLLQDDKMKNVAIAAV